MKHTDIFAKDAFLQHMYEEFPSVFNTAFSREMLENIVDYGVNHHTVTKNGLYYYLKDMVPEVEANDLIPYIDRAFLTDEVLCHAEAQELSEDEVKVVRSMDELRDYLEEKGWSVYECGIGPRSNPGWEISQHSPAGEDFNFAIEHNNDVEQAIKEIKSYAYDFDIDEHVKLNLGMRGAPGVEKLVEDAQDIQEMLDELADGVNWCEQKTIGETLADAQERAEHGNSEPSFDNKEELDI